MSMLSKAHVVPSMKKADVINIRYAHKGVLTCHTHTHVMDRIVNLQVMITKPY